MEQMQSITREGILLTRLQSVKYCGTYITSSLSEDTDVRYKQKGFIIRFNNTIYKFGFATNVVVMTLITS